MLVGKQLVVDKWCECIWCVPSEVLVLNALPPKTQGQCGVMPGALRSDNTPSGRCKSIHFRLTKRGQGEHSQIMCRVQLPAFYTQLKIVWFIREKHPSVPLLVLMSPVTFCCSCKITGYSHRLALWLSWRIRALGEGMKLFHQPSKQKVYKDFLLL